MSNYYNKNAIPIKNISPTLGLDKTKEYKKKLEIKNRNKSSKDMFKKKFNKGGRVGLKRGSFPDYSGDGKTTMKDILMGRGVIPKPKNKKKIMMAKKSKSPMDKTVRKA
jgi:hypothetical protein